MGFISLSFIVGAFLYPSIRLIFVWSAISFGIVALGYAGLGVRVFSKREDGTIPLLIKIVNLPFLFYSWGIWHLYRLLSREDAFNTIGDNVVLGRRLLSSEIPEGFDHYVDLTSEFQDPSSVRSSSIYRCFPVLDASVPSMDKLQRAVEKTKEGKVYIHCAQGHGRTGVFALALLHRRGEIEGLEDGIDLLKSERPGINLNRAQEDFITRYLSK